MGYYEDEIYHSGYLDGYYAGMELYHADDSEMTEEERRARRKRRRRNIALGVGGAAALGVGGYAIGRALRKRGRGIGPSALPGPRPRPTGPRLTGPTLKRAHVTDYDVEEPIGWDHKRNRPKYRRSWFEFDPEKADEDRRLRNSWTVWDHDNKKVADVPLSEGGLWSKEAWEARKRRKQ